MTRSQTRTPSTTPLTASAAPVCSGSRTRECPVWYIDEKQVPVPCQACDEVVDSDFGEAPDHGWGTKLAGAEVSREERKKKKVRVEREELKVEKKMKKRKQAVLDLGPWYGVEYEDVELLFSRPPSDLEDAITAEDGMVKKKTKSKGKSKSKSKTAKANGKGKGVVKEAEQEEEQQEWYDTGFGRTMEEVLSVRGLGQKFDYRPDQNVTEEDSMKEDDTVRGDDSVNGDVTVMEEDDGMKEDYDMTDEDWADLLA